MTKLSHTTVTAIFENLRIVYSDFLMIRNIVALSSLILSIKLICCFESGFSSSICLLKSIAINLQFFEGHS